jgi:hypothetical protein
MGHGLRGQLARLTDIASGPVQREIRQLVEAGLVSRQTVGTQTLYSANRESPVFREIKGLVTKTVGMHDVLAEALGPLRDVSKSCNQAAEVPSSNVTCKSPRSPSINCRIMLAFVSITHSITIFPAPFITALVMLSLCTSIVRWGRWHQRRKRQCEKAKENPDARGQFWYSLDRTPSWHS